ncbi:MAG: class I SAM-dependent methyltransferase [Patescibacteria group bacterium]|nr:class I SAM-dependent methyltransferase [Patescibacteria group bacterium]
MKYHSKKTKTSWGNVALWYDEMLEQRDNTCQKNIILPNILRLMDIKKKESILDLACGAGFFAREFLKKSGEIKGVDISRELIEIAKKNSPKEIEYFASPADDLVSVKNKTVDKIAIILAIQNIENIFSVFSECDRVLKTGGKLFLVMNHPAFRIPKQSSWEFDDKNKIQYRRIDEYMSESKTKIEMHPGKDNGERTISFHRPLQVYFKALKKNGFCVSGLEEWVSDKKSQLGPRAESENKARKEFPLFLFIEAKK